MSALLLRLFEEDENAGDERASLEADETERDTGEDGVWIKGEDDAENGTKGLLERTGVGGDIMVVGDVTGARTVVILVSVGVVGASKVRFMVSIENKRVSPNVFVAAVKSV